MKQMKKTTYILLALASFIAAACSKPSPDGPTPVGPESPKSYIFFEAGLLDVADTKAELIEGVALPTTDGFGVIGYYQDNRSIFSGNTNNIAEVNWNSSKGVYEYQNPAPWMGSTHTFHGFYPHDLLAGSVKVANNIPYIEYTQPTSESGMKDILGAYNQVTNTSAFAPVVMQFQHLLWAFNLTITNSQTAETTATGSIPSPTLTIRKVTLSLSGFPKSVLLKLDSNYSVDVITAGTLNYTLYSSTSGESIAATKSKTYGPLLFIPVKGINYQVTIEYTTAAGVEDTMVFPAEGYKEVSTEFTHGKSYNLTITKTNDKFFVGKMFNEGAWESADVPHTFQ